jgi:superfamily II DNA or RNA helicase
VSRAPTEGLFCSLSMSPLPLGAPWPPGRGPELVHGLVEGVTTHTRRDLPWEREAAARIEAALGLAAAQRTGPHAYYVPDEQAALALVDAAARHHHELQVAWAEPARALVSAGTLRPGQLAIRMFRKGDWFGLSGRQRGAATADLPLATLFEAVRRGERYVKIDGTHYAEIAEELRERLLRVEPMVQLSKAELSLAQSAVPRAVAALGGDEVELDPAARALVQAEARRDPGEPSLPPTLVPRDYQREGIAFLVQRSRWASGVCLADEMGLGKTVQTIALLWLRRALGPQLVIAPTSVLSNWESELARFAPELRVIPYGGAARRERQKELGPGTVMVASYDVILRDRAALAGQAFATQVIDEAQFVKNARTERFRAVAAIDAEFRVALSGTPIENRTGDLYSLFALIAPGLLGSWQRFRARFAVPIERYDDRERARLLRELVAPFILRREKSTVARELPERTEVVHRIELSAPERDLYDAAARAAREALDLRGRSERVPRLKVLAELTRLRQLACHPRLVLGADATASSKLRALLALLDDLLPRGHRALLFSQFTRHLDLVREALDARGVTSLTLIGETPAAERTVPGWARVGVPDLAARGRRGPQPHGCRLRDPPRSLVESGCGRSSERPRPSYRPAEAGDGGEARGRGHHRRKGARSARSQAPLVRAAVRRAGAGRGRR